VNNHAALRGEALAGGIASWDSLKNRPAKKDFFYVEIVRLLKLKI
jgi:hypothetical protein